MTLVDESPKGQDWTFEVIWKGRSTLAVGSEQAQPSPMPSTYSIPTAAIYPPGAGTPAVAGCWRHPSQSGIGAIWFSESVLADADELLGGDLLPPVRNTRMLKLPRLALLECDYDGVKSATPALGEMR